ncbi:TPA: dihydrolipoamide acetyltransferase family protein [Bacillus mycoides]
MAFEFKLPDIGEGIHEGEIVKWFIKPGDEVNEDDVLLEVQNDKAVVEIPSPVKGKVLEVLVEEGTVAIVGDTLIKFDAPGYENLKFKGDDHDEAPKAEEAAVEATPAAAAKEEAPKAQPIPAGEYPETREKMSGIRKAIAKAMVNSKHTAPHVTLMDEVDVTELVAHRKKFKAVAADKGIKLTYLPYVVKALTSALREFPMLNTALDDASQEIVHKHYFNIGIAADTDKGLLVPVVKDTDRKSIFTISNEINELAGKARDGRLAPTEMKGASCTITNIGSAGGQWFTPVINHPEVAILGIGRIAEKPVVKNGEIVAAPVLALSLSFDHRLIDGATAQKALNQIKRLLNDPQLLVMEA